MNYKHWAILWCICIGMFTNLDAQNYNQNKRVSAIYKASPVVTVSVDSKYGNINVVSWPKDSISFEVIFEIQANSQNQLQEIADNIDINFNESAYYLNAQTIFSKQRGFMSDLREASDLFAKSDSRVNYIIKVPSYVNLKIQHKYGDVFIDKLAGDLNLNLSYGSFQATELKGNSDITLMFGDAMINKINSGTIQVSYTRNQCMITHAGQLTIISKSAEIAIDEVNVLKLQSKRDKLNINKINYLYGDTYFSDITIRRLSNEASLLLKYGNFNSQMIADTFTSVQVESAYTNMDIVLSELSSYKVDVTHKQVDLTLPRRLQDKKDVLLDTKEKLQHTTGYTGRPSATSFLSIRAQNCFVKISEK